ncbi:aldose 1-epimerase [Haemophilus influenzae]|uniref:Aldose 1-epimerase n=1 Tax=Haemophilus influenzae TaxID=727 RepID=A0A2X1PR80_HAEIF|nr:aldose 1-epimerase [Haemophilus influenzae]
MQVNLSFGILGTKRRVEWSETGYQTMLCLETARIHHLLEFGESLSVEISLKG